MFNNQGGGIDERRSYNIHSLENNGSRGPSGFQRSSMGNANNNGENGIFSSMQQLHSHKEDVSSPSINNASNPVVDLKDIALKHKNEKVVIEMFIECNEC